LGADSVADQADAGVPSDREPPRSTVLSGSDTPARPNAADDAATEKDTRRTATGAGSADKTDEAHEAEKEDAGLRQAWLTASGTGSAASGPIARQVPGAAASDSAIGSAVSPATIRAVLPRLVAGLALALLVIGLVSVPGGVMRLLGDAAFNTWLFASLWPWALVAAVFVLVCRDHAWVPGAALGLLAGLTGLLGGSGVTHQWLLLGMAATALAVACFASPWWLALAGGVLGAAGVAVVSSAEGLKDSLTSDGRGWIFLLAVVGLLGLAGYRIWREQAWLSTVAPALLLLDAILTLTAEVPQFVIDASLAGLVVVPLIATLTSGVARFAGYLVVAAGLLVRANEYVSAAEPTFTSVAHVTLPLAAAIAAYFSCSR
jgi:hypothetical protein